MNRKMLGRAIDEAKRFLDRAAPLHDAMKRDEKVEDYWRHEAKPSMRGAVKRASMDLTRALADLRRPG